MLSASTDPYYVARDEMQEDIKKLRRQHEEWRRRLQNGNTADREFQKLNRECLEDIGQLNEDATHMNSMIAMVKEHRSNFPFDGAEIRTREEFIQDMRRGIKQIHDSLQSQQAQDKMKQDRQKLDRSRRVADDSAAQGKRENDAFLSREKQEQQRIHNQQEDQLAVLSRTVERLNKTAHEFGSELESQARMLDDLDDDINREAEKLNFVMRRMGKLLNTSDSNKLCVIIALFMFMMILIFLIIN